MRVQLGLLIAILSCLCYACQHKNDTFEPKIVFAPQQRFFERLPAPFEALSSQELAEDWGKELYLGRAFAREMDLYRALTCFKRALFLISNKRLNRRLEIEYDIFLAYYTANKFQDAIDVFENGKLFDVPLDFAALQELLILLYDAYQRNDQPEKAVRILNLISTLDEEIMNGLILETAVIQPDFCLIDQIAPLHSSGKNIQNFITNFQYQTKSIKKAQNLNAVLPGAGYLYVGQKKAALTSFLINALFIAAAYQLFDRGYIAAGIITASLETGWYFGGINGAGLQAKEYNERLYETLGRETLTRERLFPVLMIQKGF